MQNQRLIHDVAWAVTLHIVEFVAPLLSEEEQREAFAQIYERVKAGLECYDIQLERMKKRIRPSKN